MLKSIVSIVILTISFWTNVSAQSLNNLQQTLNGISQKYSATIGFSALDLEEGKIYSLNGDKHLPMQSVYKFHLALAVLSQVDQGKFNLDQKIHIKKNDLLPNTHSPLKDKYPNGDVSISLSDLLAYTVGQSDNNGCDILFRLLGGPAKVNSFIHVLGIQNVAIVATEEEMHRDEKVQFTNWTSPDAAVELLSLFYKKTILSEQSQDFLLKVMTESASGPKKIEGQLPEGTLVAHKTGYSGVNKNGVTAASNDIGIVEMPNGKHFAIAAFVSNTKENEKTIDRAIAELTRAVWDELSK